MRLVGQRLELQLAHPFRPEDAPDHDIELPVQQLGHQRTAVVHFHPHQDVRKFALDLGDGLRHQVGARIDHRADRSLAHAAGAQRGDFFLRPPNLRHRCACAPDQHVAIPGGLHATGMPLE